MAERFYVNCPLEPGFINVDGPEAHHLASVCRLRSGDQVRLFNGDGKEYPALVEQVAKKNVTLNVLGSEQPGRERDAPLIVAAPLPKGDRGQFLIEKLTELGVTSYVALRTRRSVVHPGKPERLERYVIEASKQCGRNVLMTVEPVTDWDKFCGREDLPKLRCLAHPGGHAGALRDEPAVIAVGPEGGWADEEIDLASRHGWTVVGLGPRILRVETAALAMVCRINGNS